MTTKKTYEDQYGYYTESGFFIFNEKCKNCGTKMDELRESGANTYGTQYLYWCPVCGTILDWYDSNSIKAGDWKTPQK